MVMHDDDEDFPEVDLSYVDTEEDSHFRETQ